MTGSTDKDTIFEEPESAALQDDGTAKQREAALRIMVGAWNDALSEGVSSDVMVSTALFVSISNIVSHYGENVAAEVVDRLPERVRKGDFTVRALVH